MDVTRSFTKLLGEAAVASFLISSTLSACQPKLEPVKPNGEQQASLNKLHKKCILAAATTPSKKLTNLVRHRKPELFFTCDEMKQLCENDCESSKRGPQLSVLRVRRF